MTALVTDRNVNLIAACHCIFPKAKQLVCLWHLNKNLVTAGKGLQEKDEWEGFLKDWRRYTVWAKTPELYEEGMVKMNELYVSNLPKLVHSGGAGESPKLVILRVKLTLQIWPQTTLLPGIGLHQEARRLERALRTCLDRWRYAPRTA